MNCKSDPRAPHGFCRDESHSENRYVCECEFWEPPTSINSFNEWWNGLVGFHLNSERAFEEIDPVNAKRLEPWMKACWNAAIEAAKDKTENHRGWSDLDGRWIDPDDLGRQLEKLKTS